MASADRGADAAALVFRRIHIVADSEIAAGNNIDVRAELGRRHLALVLRAPQFH